MRNIYFEWCSSSAHIISALYGDIIFKGLIRPTFSVHYCDFSYITAYKIINSPIMTKIEMSVTNIYI